MGLDLQLLPFDADGPTLAHSHTILNCERRHVLFEQIGRVEWIRGRLVPAGFVSYVSRAGNPDSDGHYGETLESGTGEKLRTLLACELLVWASDRGVQDNHINRAIWAYLSHLPPQTRVALYWC